LHPPYIFEKICDRLIDRNKAVFNFLAAHMPVVALARLVVLTQHTISLNNKCQPVLVAMLASGNRFGHFPQHLFRKRLFRDYYAAIE